MTDGSAWSEALLQEGLARHRRGQRDEALDRYQQCLAQEPKNVAALNLAGVALLELGRADEGRPYLEKAVRLHGRDAALHNNFGNLLTALDEDQKAERHYQKALDLKPGYGDAWRNLGRLYSKAPSVAQAVDKLQKAVLRRRRDAEGHFTLGCLVQHHGAFDVAQTCFRDALKANPQHAEAGYKLAMLHYYQEQWEEALEGLESVLAIDPGHGKAKFWHDAMKGHIQPGAADHYVRSLFDDYAERYDGHLTEYLLYQGPTLIAEALKRHAGGERFSLALDLGCGTGLLAPIIEPHCEELIGVDLSGEMLRKAEAGGLYDALYRDDLVSYLTGEGALRTYDLALAGDVLGYVGDLAPVFEALYPTMSAGGLFLFTLEEKLSEGGGLALTKSGRYQHRRDYLEEMAVQAGFEILSVDQRTLRHERKQPVAGLLVALKKPN